jgi:hypothetical protein
MRVFASGLARTVKLGIAPCYLLALLVGCDSGGAPSVPSASSSDAPKATAPIAKTLSPEEKKKPRGAGRTASGVTPTGAE